MRNRKPKRTKTHEDTANVLSYLSCQTGPHSMVLQVKMKVLQVLEELVIHIIPSALTQTERMNVHKPLLGRNPSAANKTYQRKCRAISLRNSKA